jgi:hypothetical protein
VAGAKGVEGALAASQEAAGTVGPLDAAQRSAPTGERLVGIPLVPHVPHEEVARGVEDVVEGDAELDHAEAGREVAAHLGAQADQRLAQLARDLGQVAAGQTPQVLGIGKSVEQPPPPLAATSLPGASGVRKGNR